MRPFKLLGLTLLGFALTQPFPLDKELNAQTKKHPTARVFMYGRFVQMYLCYLERMPVPFRQDAMFYVLCKLVAIEFLLM